MTTTALITFLLVAGIVWGGLLLIVTTAVRREGQKARQGQ